MHLPHLPSAMMMRLFEDERTHYMHTLESQPHWFPYPDPAMNPGWIKGLVDRWNVFFKKASRGAWTPSFLCFYSHREKHVEVEVRFRHARLISEVTAGSWRFDCRSNSRIENLYQEWRRVISEINKSVDVWNETELVFEHPFPSSDFELEFKAMVYYKLRDMFWESDWVDDELEELFENDADDWGPHFEQWLESGGIIPAFALWSDDDMITISFGANEEWIVFLDGSWMDSACWIRLCIRKRGFPFSVVLWNYHVNKEEEEIIEVKELELLGEVLTRADLTMRQWNLLVDGSANRSVELLFVQGSAGNLGCDAFLGPPQLPGDVARLLDIPPHKQLELPLGLEPDVVPGA